MFIICFALQSCSNYLWFPLGHAISHFYMLLFVILENFYVLQDSPHNAITCFLLLLFQIFLCVAQLTSTCLCFLNSVWSILNWELPLNLCNFSSWEQHCSQYKKIKWCWDKWTRYLSLNMIATGKFGCGWFRICDI